MYQNIYPWRPCLILRKCKLDSVRYQIILILALFGMLYISSSLIYRKAVKNGNIHTDVLAVPPNVFPIYIKAEM